MVGRFLALGMVVFLLCTGLDSAAAQAQEPVELLVSAAASLTDVMPKLAEVYAGIAPLVTLTFTYGSSGALRAQIEEGAPVDVFISANMKHMNALLDDNLILPDSNFPLLENKVVLIVPLGSETAIASFEDLVTDAVPLVGMGEPTSVPAGQYAQQVFTSLGIWDAISAKANFATDVRQVLMWVEEGAVDCGVVYATDAMTTDAVSVLAEAPEGSCDSIIYPAAAIISTAQADEALNFMAFLTTAEAMAVFESFGFSAAPVTDGE